MTAVAKSAWYVLTSKPREEQRAHDNLVSQGLEVFLPKVATVKKKKGIKAVSLDPLFPNYLFIRLNPEQANFNAVRSTRGVGSFVKFGLQHAVISNDIINALQHHQVSNNEPKTLEQLLNLQVGDKVQINQGPFAGLEAIYKAKDGLERSILMVKMLGKENDVPVDNQHFDKVS
ncbi:transcription/translation regulatory transformer protein RfaH [Thalassotalea ponticola]|uniref:transcription/translation regulatory transformer protein RfaH n=1 Tax=Thalassotalea ponticola TaxID=1523392 RepID=UPI0025B50595|nr:transcription/translation regulatory transformer protein RfaH [Thalassotalea ponticola]MDN3652641.1 transcription/translation regulatory transformer protein RfaH [Thalassotalea ponticola]